MAIETFKIVNNVAPACLQNLIHLKDTLSEIQIFWTYQEFRQQCVTINLSNLPQQQRRTTSRIISGLKITFIILQAYIQSWNGSRVDAQFANSFLMLGNIFMLS